MSNMIHIQRRKITLLKSGKSWKEIALFDDYASDAIDLETLGLNTMPMNDLELLEAIIGLENNTDAIVSMLDCIQENNCSITIDDTFYEWDEVKHLFAKYWE